MKPRDTNRLPPLIGILGTHTESVLSRVTVSRLKYDQNDLTDQGDQVEEKPESRLVNVVHSAPEDCQTGD